ncbi:MAG: hypothetical protein KDC45_00665 [Bacteroidetes bacterium]|nr:hypothetical protein [Bacteroidota bacterium]
MKSAFLAFLATVLVTPLLLAQGKANLDSDKQKVAIMPFDVVKIANSVKGRSSYSIDATGVNYESTPNDVFADVDAVAAFGEGAMQKVVNAFVKLKRFTILDRTAMENIMKEQNFQMSDNVSNAVVNAGNMLGARYICQGQLQQVSSTETSKGSGIYYATVELQIRIIDVETGEITASKDFKGESGSKMNRLEACYDGLNEAESKIYTWLRTAFPVEGEILEIGSKGKGKKASMMITITAGKDLGVRPGDVFRVYTESEVEVAGKLRKRTVDVGMMKVVSVNEDGWSSVCDPGKSGKDIQAKYDSGVKLKVVQTKK